MFWVHSPVYVWLEAWKHETKEALSVITAVWSHFLTFRNAWGDQSDYQDTLTLLPTHPPDFWGGDQSMKDNHQLAKGRPPAWSRRRSCTCWMPPNNRPHKRCATDLPISSGTSEMSVLSPIEYMSRSSDVPSKIKPHSLSQISCTYKDDNTGQV